MSISNTKLLPFEFARSNGILVREIEGDLILSPDASRSAITEVSRINSKFATVTRLGKEDFDKIHNILDNLEKKYEKTKIIIWYPILNYSENDLFIESIRKKGISNLINVELPVKANNEDRGMKGSGLLIMNFNEKKIMKDLKNLLKDLHLYLKQNDEVYNPKVRYL